MSAAFRTACSLGLGAALLLGGCDAVGPKLFLSARDREIESATRAIESARNDAGRAEALSRRARAHSEKARYSRFFKRISAEDYARVFGLALGDHDQAVALDPGNAEVYYGRGWTCFDRATLEDPKDAGPWLARAAADLTKAVEKDPRHDLAWDRLGLVHLRAGETDKAIDAFKREMALAPLGKSRLADVHCDRGLAELREKKIDAAIADLERSIEYGSNADGCSCEPYNPLVGLYERETRQYDKAWAVVGQAAKRGKVIAPELVESLVKSSGRRG